MRESDVITVSPAAEITVFGRKMETRVAYFGGGPQTVMCAITRNAGEMPFTARIQFGCSHGTIFHSQDCDCGEQVRNFLKFMSEADRNCILIYFTDHEAYGIGSFEKMKVLELELKLGKSFAELENDGLVKQADYSILNIVPYLFREIGITGGIYLESSSIKKRNALRNFGISIIDERLPNDNDEAG